MRHLECHLAPRRLALAGDELCPVGLEVAPHAVEGQDQGLELAHALEREGLLPVSTRQPVGEGGEPLHRARDLGRPEDRERNRNRESQEAEKERRQLHRGDRAVSGLSGDHPRDRRAHIERDGPGQICVPARGGRSRGVFARGGVRKGRRRDPSRPIAQDQAHPRRLSQPSQECGVELEPALDRSHGLPLVTDGGSGDQREPLPAGRPSDTRHVPGKRGPPRPGDRAGSARDHAAARIRNAQKIQPEQDLPLREKLGEIPAPQRAEKEQTLELRIPSEELELPDDPAPILRDLGLHRLERSLKALVGLRPHHRLDAAREEDHPHTDRNDRQQREGNDEPCTERPHGLVPRASVVVSPMPHSTRRPSSLLGLKIPYTDRVRSLASRVKLDTFSPFSRTARTANPHSPSRLLLRHVP